VSAAVRTIRAMHGVVRIAALARALGIAQDPLEKRFRAMIGASPKQYAEILRLRRAIESYHSGASLTRASIEAGYFDQPHFNRDFRAVEYC
jgi:transcriptional regulator GlxA family with amidase domain